MRCRSEAGKQQQKKLLTTAEELKGWPFLADRFTLGNVLLDLTGQTQ